uniref:Adaptor related protein complex 3 subunit sigma 1 n=1 Tax=Bos taurus TaxID=9913 RepID=A0AAA9RTN1_BOVIN
KLLFFLVSPTGSSVPGETAAEEGGSGVAVSGETSVGTSASGAVEGGSCSADSCSSAILLGGKGGRKRWLSECSGRALLQRTSLERHRGRGGGEPNPDSESQSEDTQQQIIRETFHLVSKRDENVCNFLEGGLLIGGSDNKLIYRHYATLYFVFCVDSSESELGILDLIQVFVETLDKCFENVCELDLIFHVDKVHNILAEMVMGGMVLETNMNEIVTQIDAQNKLEKSEAGLAGAPARAVSAVKNMNLPEIPRNINIGDISIKVPNLPSFK